MEVRTIREEFRIRLIDRGLWPNEANEVLTLAMANESLEPMLKRWNDGISEYPAKAIAVSWILVKRVALDWINANKPSHFAKMLLSVDTSPNLGTAN